MAKENVKKFYEELSINKELQEKFMAAQQDYEAEGKSEEEIFEDIVLPIAKEAGYEFTMSEYKNAQREAMAEKGISEEELENVSGGSGFCIFIGYGRGVGACIALGAKLGPDSSITGGAGVTFCSRFGLGLGGVI